MVDPDIPLYRIRVLDPVSGNVLIDPLPHPHGSTLEVRGIQPGAVGSSSIGAFSIPLFDPGSDERAAATIQYGQLAYGQRVEFYTGDVLAATPAFTGVITQLPNSLNNYTIRGADSTFLAQRARTDRNYSFNGTTDTLLKNGLKSYALVYGDDQCNSLSGYTNNGGWTTTTDENLNVFQAGAAGVGALYTTTSYSNANYSDCVIDAVFHLVCGSTAGNNAEAAVVAAVTDANNFIYARANMICYSSTLWGVSVDIVQRSGGVDTVQAAPGWSKSLTSGTLRCQVRLFGTQNGASYTWRAVLNGYDVGSSFTYTATPSGAVGVRSNRAATGYGSSTCYATQICFMNKQNIFQAGAVSAGSLSLNQKFSKTPLIELWNVAATTEGVQWRKNPKAGLNNDTVDFGTLGTDLSGAVQIEEGLNLLEPSTVEPNADPPATDIELNAPGTNNQQTISWHNITAIKKYGLLTDTVSSGYTADFLSQRATAKAIANQRATPGNAKTLTILRDARYLGSTPTGLSFRELDSISVTSARLGLFQQKVQVLGYAIREGRPDMTLFCDQFPLSSSAGQDMQLRRLWQQVDALANATQSVTGGAIPLVVNTAGTAIVDNFGLINVMSNLGYSAGAGSSYSTANSSTWTDIASSFSITLSRPAYILYLIFATGRITAGTNAGYVRGNIVGVSATASPYFTTPNSSNGTIWYYPTGGRVAAGTYTVTMQAATDNSSTTLTVDQYFHQVFLLGG